MAKKFLVIVEFLVKVFSVKLNVLDLRPEELKMNTCLGALLRVTQRSRCVNLKSMKAARGYASSKVLAKVFP